MPDSVEDIVSVDSGVQPDTNGVLELEQHWHSFFEEDKQCPIISSSLDENVANGSNEEEEEWGGFMGYEYGNNIEQLVAHELATLVELEDLFLRNFAENSLLCYQQGAESDQETPEEDWEVDESDGKNKNIGTEENKNYEHDANNDLRMPFTAPQEQPSQNLQYIPDRDKVTDVNPVRPKPPRVDPPRGKGKKRSGCVVM